MIIDGHVHITDDPEPSRNWPAFDSDALISLMDEEIFVGGRSRVIDKAAVMPMLWPTLRSDLTFRQQHQIVIDAVAKFPDRLVGTFVLNPHHGVAAGVTELRRLVSEDGFRMVKLHPTAHHYLLKNRSMTDPIFEAAAELGIPVLIHTGDPPHSIPALVEPLAADHPDTVVIIAHLGTQRVCYADDAINVALHCDNVYLETGWGPLPRLAEAAIAIGADRLVFGSDCPVQDPFSQLRVVESLARDGPLGVNLSPDAVEAIMGNNHARLLQIS